MRISGIIHDSIVDGDGLRTVVFFQGCRHKCEGCHNPVTWDSNSGVKATIFEILTEIKKNPLSDVTLSGGDPLFQPQSCIELAKELKKIGKNIWLYTGYTFEQIVSEKELLPILDYVDVIVDGRFDKGLRDVSLQFRGSSNQRIIDVKKTKESGELILWE